MGSKFNYFRIISVDSVSFSTVPQVSFGFIPQGFSFINRGVDVIEYSFDGSTVHGDLDPSDESIGLTFNNRLESKVWFRSPGAPQNVRVEAWGGWGKVW